MESIPANLDHTVSQAMLSLVDTESRNTESGGVLSLGLLSSGEALSLGRMLSLGMLNPGRVPSLENAESEGPTVPMTAKPIINNNYHVRKEGVYLTVPLPSQLGKV